MVSVLVPAFNEAEWIPTTLAAIRAISPPVDELIVVDDGSSDDTAARAEAAGADVVLRRRNGGKGSALQCALELAKGDVLLLLDADLGATAAQASRLLEPVISGAADMAIGAFTARAGSGGGIGLVVKLARWGILRLTGQAMQTPLSGQRALKRSIVRDIGGFPQGWGVEIGLTVSALRLGYKVLEIPTTMTHRVTGRSPSAIVHRARQFFGAAGILLRLWLSRSVRPAPEPEPERK